MRKKTLRPIVAIVRTELIVD